MKYIILLLLPFFISFKTLDKNFRGMTTHDAKVYLDVLSTKKSAIKKAPVKVVRKRGANSSRLSREIYKLRKLQNFSPSFGEEFGNIKTMERFKGLVEGNIKVSGSPVRFKINIADSDKFPVGSYIACTGTASAGKYNYRIISHCDRLITYDDEFKIDVRVKDSKLTDGIEADYVYTGLEEEILGNVFTTAASVMIDSQKDRVLTSLGFASEPSSRNAILSGLSAGAASANKTIKENNNDSYVLLAVEDQKEVIIEFNRSFSYDKKK